MNICRIASGENPQSKHECERGSLLPGQKVVKELTGDRCSQWRQGNNLGGSVGVRRMTGYPIGWFRVFSSETVWDLVGFGKPLKGLKQWDD